MGSTNKTPNLDLSQFVDTDKPTYRGDYNRDMSIIDTKFSVIDTLNENYDARIRSADTKATTASTAAEAANTTAGNAVSAAQAAAQDAAGAQAAADAATVAQMALAPKDSVWTKAQADARYVATPVDEIAVFIGNSHASGGSFPSRIADALGVTLDNRAVGATGVTYGGTNQYRQQAARAITSHQNAGTINKVTKVFIVSFDNDSRAKVNITTDLDALISQVKAGFPAARIIIIPMLVGTSGNNTEYENMLSASLRVEEATRCAIAANVEIIGDSLTWAWGRSDLMHSGDIHFTANGDAWITGFVLAYLKGGNTTYNQGWRTVPLTGGVAPAGGNSLKASRYGETVKAIGTIGNNGASAIAANTDIGTFPEGMRPIDDIYMEGYTGGSNNPTQVRIWVFRSGGIRLVEPLPASSFIRVNETFPAL